MQKKVKRGGIEFEGKGGGIESEGKGGGRTRIDAEK